jgi:hypothetical protein
MNGAGPRSRRVSIASRTAATLHRKLAALSANLGHPERADHHQRLADEYDRRAEA